MGNCVLKLGFGDPGLKSPEVVRVVTPSGGIMELLTPVTADSITAEFPNHAIFAGGEEEDIFSRKILHSDDLRPGPKPYYLLPLTGLRDENVKSTPYRMSCDGQVAAPEVVPRYSSGGVWKVKLVISPRELSEILSQESRTEALIESVRTVAKCGAGGVAGGSSVSGSDQWSTISGSSCKGLG